jgi:hypothetical protein
MKQSQRLGGHCIAYCKLLVLNLLVLEARFEHFLSQRDEIGTENYNV